MLPKPTRPNPNKQRVSGDHVWPAPTGGWDASSSLAQMDKLRAVSLVNWWPQPGYIEVRKGSENWASGIGSTLVTVTTDENTDTITTSSTNPFVDNDVVIVYVVDDVSIPQDEVFYVTNTVGNDFQITQDKPGTVQTAFNFDATTGTMYAYQVGVWNPETESIDPGGGAVQTLIPYEVSDITTGPKLLAAGGGAIWDATLQGIATPIADNAGTPFLNDKWQYTNFATPDPKNFIIACNGSDGVWSYEVSTGWASISILDGGVAPTAFDPTKFINVTAHKGRLWFVEKGTPNAVYLDTPQAVSGDATLFPLGPFFTKGGRLQEIVSWTKDGGSGPDDFLVFISSKGQAAVYAGIDPGATDATGFIMVGVFDVGEPIGDRCVVSYGADPLLITTSGLLKLRIALGEDEAKLEATSHTARIYREITDIARRNKDQFGWECVQYPASNMLILNVPFGANSVQGVQNTLTGAWCQFNGWPAITFAVFQDELYFGTADGKTVKADVGSNDSGASVVATGETSYSNFGSVGQKKQFKMMQAMVLAQGLRRPALGLSTDFATTSDMSTQVSAAATSLQWNDFQWNAALWPGGTTALTDWTSPRKIGTWASVKFEVTTTAAGGGDIWDVGQWDFARWGAGDPVDEQVQINGFVVVYEKGEFL